MTANSKKLGLFALTALVISSSIGSGIFNISKDMSESASPGAAFIAWVIVGTGVLMLCLSLLNLLNKKPELSGILSYAEEGFGPFGGFISGWGYWLSAWLGNVAFATIMMSAVAYFFPVFEEGNNLPSILVASVILWLMFFLVNRGVEGAAVLNGIITVCKLVPLAIFIVIALFAFNWSYFLTNFWGTASGNFELVSVFDQVQNSLMVLMWVFVGIEGAAMMSDRAESKSIVGKSTILGLVGLIGIYMLASILPYGLMPREEIAQLSQPTMGYILESVVGSWGPAMVNIGLIISVFGSWLSWTMLPAETTLLMSKSNLLPKKFGELNDKNSPTFSLFFMTVLTQLFVFTLLFTDQAYQFAYSLCTAAIFVSWLLVTLYQTKLSAQLKETGQLVIGVLGSLFYLWAIWASGIEYFLLCLCTYIIGLVLYVKARKDVGVKRVFNRNELIMVGLILFGSVVAVVLLVTGQISF